MPFIFSELGRRGRLGNQLWQIAATIGLAHTHKTAARFPRWEYAPFFSVPEEYFVEPERLRGEEAYKSLDYMDERARVFMQDVRLFEAIAPRIRDYFAPSNGARQLLESLDWFNQLPSDRLALHIRRGDLSGQSPGYAPLCSLAYYRDAVALHPEAAIVVFSDDLAWCRRALPEVLEGRLVYTSDGRKLSDASELPEGPTTGASPDWLDLQLMARCEHHVLANSSYSWWGAFLSDDPSPVYPTNWYGFQLRDWNDASLMFPAGWRAVANSTQGGVVRGDDAGPPLPSDYEPPADALAGDWRFDRGIKGVGSVKTYGTASTPIVKPSANGALVMTPQTAGDHVALPFVALARQDVQEIDLVVDSAPNETPCLVQCQDQAYRPLGALYATTGRFRKRLTVRANVTHVRVCLMPDNLPSVQLPLRVRIVAHPVPCSPMPVVEHGNGDR